MIVFSALRGTFTGVLTGEGFHLISDCFNLGMSMLLLKTVCCDYYDLKVLGTDFGTCWSGLSMMAEFMSRRSLLLTIFVNFAAAGLS